MPALIATKLKTRRCKDPDSKDRDEETDPTLEPERRCPQPGTLEGWESLGRVVIVDQSPLGRTPRSNPAVYTGAFDEIRAFFAQTETARQRGLGASAFSFNSAQGQCERCRGAGFEKIEMQFLSDIFIRCPECNGRRYRPHILEVTARLPGARKWNIADLLEATVDQGDRVPGAASPNPAPRGGRQTISKLLQELGLGYLRLGQPINTLSGGESQRLKLVKHLAQARESAVAPARKADSSSSSTSRPPGCTSTTFASCSKSSSGWSMRATPFWSSSTISTS